MSSGTIIDYGNNVRLPLSVLKYTLEALPGTQNARTYVHTAKQPNGKIYVYNRGDSTDKGTVHINEGYLYFTKLPENEQMELNTVSGITQNEIAYWSHHLQGRGGIAYEERKGPSIFNIQYENEDALSQILYITSWNCYAYAGTDRNTPCWIQHWIRTWIVINKRSLSWMIPKIQICFWHP